jgi:hypothetical protein
VAVLAGILDVALDLLQGAEHPDLARRRQAPGGQRLVGVGLGGGLEALTGTDAVADHAERPGGGDARVLLAQGPRRGVAGVGEGRLPGLGQRLVEPLEGLDRKEHLPTHLQQLGDREVL